LISEQQLAFIRFEAKDMFDIGEKMADAMGILEEANF